MLWSWKMISRIGFRVIRWERKKHWRHCRVYKYFFFLHRSRKEFAQTTQKSEFKLVKIYNGIMTEAPFIAQKRTVWQNGPSAEWKERHLSYLCKVDYLKNGGTVRWGVFFTCATSTTKWPMARQYSRRDLARHLTYSLRHTGLGTFESPRRTSHGSICLDVSRAGEDGHATYW